METKPTEEQIREDAVFTDTVYGLFAKEKTAMRLIEYFKVSVFRLKEFWLYTVCGIPFYRNYERFYWRKVVTIKDTLEECWNAAHQAGRFEGKGIAEENWNTFEDYYNETYKH